VNNAASIEKVRAEVFTTPAGAAQRDRGMAWLNSKPFRREITGRQMQEYLDCGYHFALAVMEDAANYPAIPMVAEIEPTPTDRRWTRL